MSDIFFALMLLLLAVVMLSILKTTQAEFHQLALVASAAGVIIAAGIVGISAVPPTIEMIASVGAFALSMIGLIIVVHSRLRSETDINYN